MEMANFIIWASRSSPVTAIGGMMIEPSYGYYLLVLTSSGAC